jgi:hypothetical protein
MLALTTRTSLIIGAACIGLLLLLSAFCPGEAAGATVQGVTGAFLHTARTDDDHPPNPVPPRLFFGDEVLEFTLLADFDQLLKDRDQESEERPGRLILTALDGTPREIPLKVRTRGNFRLDKRNCSFPPLRLNLPRGDLQGTVLDGQNKLKVVTHCRGQNRYEQNLLEEYLAYRILNLVTEVSFRPQLARITYVDVAGKRDTETRYAFLIESKKGMAARLDGTFLDPPGLHPDEYDQPAAGLMYLFQFLIGNEDWSSVYFHNMKLIRIDNRAFPVPFDFDWSGLVWAPYAEPHPEFRDQMRTVRQRLYRGFCSDRIDHPQLVRQFRESKAEILDLIQELPGLEEENIRSATEYVEEFYGILGDPKSTRRKILDACRPT